MNTLITSAFVASLSCSSVNFDEIKTTSYFDSSMWLTASCLHFKRLGNDIRIEPLNNEVQFIDEDNVKGTFTFSQLKNGRTRLTWISKTQQLKKSLWLKVQVFKKVPVANKDIKIFGVIGNEDFIYKKVDVASLMNNENIQSIKVLPNYVALNNLRAGQVITANNIRKKPFFYRADKVKINVLSKNITITAVGEALDIGWALDDKVRVLIDNTSKPVIASVIGERQVNVK